MAGRFFVAFLLSLLDSGEREREREREGEVRNERGKGRKRMGGGGVHSNFSPEATAIAGEAQTQANEGSCSGY